MMTQENQSPFIVYLREHWLHLLVIAFLIVFPHLVGWLTGDSPFGSLRGSRVIMSGQSTYWQSVFIRMFALAVLVMSYNLMFGFTGVVSFGHALFFGLGSYILGLSLQFWNVDPNIALFAAVIAVIVVNAILGLLMGLASLRLKGVYFTIFTMALAEMAWIYVRSWEKTNGEDGLNINIMPEWIDPNRSRLTVYYIGMALFVLSFWLIRRVVKSPAGTVFQAIRENEERAQAIGYNTLYYKLFSIVIASVMAGTAGILLAILDKSAKPEVMSVGYTVDALLMTIIGGVGTFAGPVLGAAGLYLTEDALRETTLTIGSIIIPIGENWALFLGIVFVVVVLVFPYGIVGTWYKLRARLTKRGEQSTAHPQAAATFQPDARHDTVE